MNRLSMFLIFLVGTCPAFADNRLFSLDDGLTLAEVEKQGRRHTIAVMSDSGGQIEGLDLSKSLGVLLPPVELYAAKGYQALVDAIRRGDDSAVERYDYKSLLSPAGQSDHHIAAGLNYSEHAEEVDAEVRPFLFLKSVRATREEPIKYEPSRLLDYEVEMCARPLKTLRQAEAMESDFAYFLCGDFTDRALLLREMDTDDMQSGEGFSVAKSLKNYFPTGPYLFIPKPGTQPIKSIALQLTVNGLLRQNARAENMIWSIDDIVKDVFDAQNSRRQTHRSSASKWLPNDSLGPTISLLTGTPDGVIMKPPSFWYKATRGSVYFVSGAFLSDTWDSVKQFVKASYIDDLLQQGSFLSPGDEVVLSATGLGEIRIGVVQ